MSTELLISIFVPVGLCLMMLGLGLSLQVEDFVRIRQQSRPVIVGLGIQLLVLPVLAFILAKAFSLSPLFAVGLMLLSAAPGGPSANLYSHLAGGEVALNVTLTAINSIIAIVFIPFIIHIAFILFMGSEKAIPLQFAKFIQVVGFILIPIAVGMWIRKRYPQWSLQQVRKVKIASIVFLILLSGFGIAKEWQKLAGGIADLGLVILIFNCSSLVLGYWIAKSLKLTLKETIAITIEVGLHNCAIVLAIAMSPTMLNSIEMALPAALYAFLMQVTVGFTAYLFYRQTSA